jgi:hypothetical protein
MPLAESDSSAARRAPSAAALTAFLHGIQPRAWVFGLCQAGDPHRADQALAGAERDFLAEAATHPLSEWPMRFWEALLRQPALLAPLDPGQELARIEPGPRAALLLRLLASLDVPHAAEALGVSVPAYEAALGQALSPPGAPQDWLAALRLKLQALVHEMPAPTRAHLDELRLRVQAELAAAQELGAPSLPPLQLDEEPALEATPDWHPPRWPWFGLGLLLLALLATLLFPLPSRLRPGESERLPSEAVAPPPALSDTVVVTHPDYAQLAAPQDESYARELGFYSWHAANLVPAGSAAAPDAAEVPPAPAPADFAALSDREQHMLSAAAPLWPALSPEERAALRANANDWSGKPSPQRAALRARLQAWDAQPAPERARRRSAFLAWQALTPSEQSRVRAAQSRFAALPAAEQKAIRARFAALDADTQRVWGLGPALGRQLAPIALLFAFLPEDDRPALLDALRGLDPVARAELSLLAPHLEAGPRQALRKQLLALPPEARAAFIHERLGAARVPQ